jgi:hypothetical protein
MGEMITVRNGKQVLVDSYVLETDQRATFSVQTLTGNLVLGTGSLSYYSLDPGADNRTVTIPSAAAIPFKKITILNSGTGKTLTIGDGGINPVIIKKGEQYIFNSDGTNWYARRQ